MIKSVVREHHWAPNIVGALFIDDIDHEGLIYWYDDIHKMHQELKKKK